MLCAIYDAAMTMCYVCLQSVHCLLCQQTSSNLRVCTKGCDRRGTTGTNEMVEQNVYKETGTRYNNDDDDGNVMRVR